MRDEVRGRGIALPTNRLGFDPAAIAAVYKERWRIELFFKSLKQSLKIKIFVGASENALRIQIWTALARAMNWRPVSSLSGRNR